MIEVVAHEKFYKDVAHEPLHFTVPKGSLHHFSFSSYGFFSHYPQWWCLLLL
jgi:hypothetical protein